MKKRTPVSATELYLLLDREWKRRQALSCNSCYLQFPYRVDRDDAAEGANWEILLPAHCSLACRTQIEEVVNQLSDHYDLDPAH